MLFQTMTLMALLVQKRINILHLILEKKVLWGLVKKVYKIESVNKAIKLKMVSNNLIQTIRVLVKAFQSNHTRSSLHLKL